MFSIFTRISSFPLLWPFWTKLWGYPARFLYLWHYDSLIQNTWTSSRWRPLKLNSLRKGNGLELFVQQLLLALTLISAQKCFSSRRQVRTNCINLASRNETTRCQLSCFYLLTLPHRITNKIFILQTNFSKTLAGAGLNWEVFTQVLGISRPSTYTHGGTFREHLSFPPTSASITKT